MSHPVVDQLRQITSSRTIGDASELIKIIDQAKLKYLGSGSSRVVWSLGDGTVIKIALGPDETPQNKSEVEAFNCAGPEYLAEVFDHDSDQFWWLVMEEVKTRELNGIIKKWFPTPAGVHPMDDNFESMIWAPHVLHAKLEQNKKLTPEERKNIISWLDGFQRVISKCDISTKDMRTPNVGVRPSTGFPVVIDYANFDLLKWESVVPSLNSLLFESTYSQHPLLKKVRAAKTKEALMALTETPQFMRDFIGEGSTRGVYSLGADKVLKLEKLESDTQNKSEVEVFKCSGPEFFAEIYDYDKQNFWWLVMERTNTRTEAVEKKLTSYFGRDSKMRFIERLTYYLSENRLLDVLDAINTNQASTPTEKEEAKIWARHFASVINTCDINTMDLTDANVSVRPATNQIIFHDYADYDLAGASLSEIIFSP